MNRLFRSIALLLFSSLLCSISCVSAEPVVIPFPHETCCPGEYYLHPTADSAGYLGICTVCALEIDVQPPEADFAAGTADTASCMHAYRRAAAPVKLVWEPCTWPDTANGRHQQNTHYDLICDLCGDTATGILLGTEDFRHVNIELANFHPDAEINEHIVLYQCQVCGQYSMERYLCWPAEDKGFGMCDWLLKQYLPRTTTDVNMN